MISDHLSLIQYVNPAWKKLYGYSDEEVIGRSPRLIHSGLQTQRFYKKMWESLNHPEVNAWEGRLVNRTKNGEFVTVHLNIHPLKNAQSEIIGYMGLTTIVFQ